MEVAFINKTNYYHNLLISLNLSYVSYIQDVNFDITPMGRLIGFKINDLLLTFAIFKHVF